jgi:hypothetical protein
VNKKPYIEKNFSTWKQFNMFVDNLSEDWIFRGQSNSEWELKSSLERSEFFNKYENVEINFLTEFQRGAKNFIKGKDTPEYLFEWLALMQHHGAPTRLLDFTKSPYVASYFAYEDVDKITDKIAIWAIDIRRANNIALNHLLHNYSSLEEIFKKNNFKLNEEIKERIYFLNEYDCIFSVEPFRMNNRYYLQQSIFVCTGNSIVPFMDQFSFLEDFDDKPFVKIILPAKIRKEILINLQKMNINKVTLFPDLDGFAFSLKMKYSLDKNSHEYIEDKIKEMKYLESKKVISKIKINIRSKNKF